MIAQNIKEEAADCRAAFAAIPKSLTHPSRVAELRAEPVDTGPYILSDKPKIGQGAAAGDAPTDSHGVGSTKREPGGEALRRAAATRGSSTKRRAPAVSSTTRQ